LRNAVTSFPGGGLDPGDDGEQPADQDHAEHGLGDACGSASQVSRTRSTSSPAFVRKWDAVITSSAQQFWEDLRTSAGKTSCCHSRALQMLLGTWAHWCSLGLGLRHGAGQFPLPISELGASDTAPDAMARRLAIPGRYDSCAHGAEARSAPWLAPCGNLTPKAAGQRHEYRRSAAKMAEDHWKTRNIDLTCGNKLAGW
jgi:hypothetical protein